MRYLKPFSRYRIALLSILLVGATALAVTAPNGRYIIFNALGQLWKKNLQAEIKEFMPFLMTS